MDPTEPSFLSSPSLRLIVFGGKGGVGKTTCAAATALTLAERDPRSSHLLASTDPAHSVVDGLSGSALPANLRVIELDAEERLAAFRSAHGARLKEIAARGTFLDDDDVNQFLDLSLPGLDELIAFLEISRWVDEDHYARIVVDTAPWGHTLRLLEMPELIGRWLGMLDALLAKHRYMKKLYSGGYRRDELDRFLLELAAAVDRVKKILRNPDLCRFVPVTLAERLSVSETVGLVADLDRLKVPVTDVVVNRLYPDLQSCPACAEGRARQLREIARIHEELSGYAFWAVPLLPYEPRGRERLEALWSRVAAVATAVDIRCRPAAPVAPRVEGAPPLPSPETQLLIFGGKGGVGKTTLACTTALRLATERPDLKTLLVSTDPAASLAVCLDQAVGPEPTRVSAGLAAMEIDAPAEFETLKRQYAAELERTLASLLRNLDLTFDRQVMERILDLSPPGLDEVMALSRAAELLAAGTCDLLVLDAAPTGHLVRLLEMPELIDRWLKVVFGVLLKYRNVLRLSGVSKTLVRLSKDLKRFRTLLADQRRAALYVVTIPTEMAYEETRDLLAACERLKVNVPVLFINLATPESDCPLCTALRHRESRVEGRLAGLFPQTHRALVYRCEEPQGQERLRKLGRALYVPQ